MSNKRFIQSLFRVMKREVDSLVHAPIYWFSMIVFPLFVIFFFSELMNEGLPTDMPVGVVDLDNSTTSRKLLRNYDAFQQSHIVAHYSDVNQARRAMQKCEIYAFMYIPQNMERDLLASRQPKISFYYNNSVLLAGSLIYKEMRAISTLGAASVGSAKLQAKGLTQRQIKSVLQPIATDVHAIDNPMLNYNIALSTTIIPACLALFVLLVTAYSLGIELKKNRAKTWMTMAENKVMIALAGKFIPQTVIFTLVVWFYQYWLFVHLDFPHNCNFLLIMIVGLTLVVAAQCFAIFVFSLLPTLRMSMSICALWGVLSFSISGFTYPVTSMSPSLQILSNLFPMRHYYMIYQMNILHGYSLHYSWMYIVALLVFMMLPLFMLSRLKKIFYKYVYLP